MPRPSSAYFLTSATTLRQNKMETIEQQLVSLAEISGHPIESTVNSAPEHRAISTHRVVVNDTIIQCYSVADIEYLFGFSIPNGMAGLLKLIGPQQQPETPQPHNIAP